MVIRILLSKIVEGVGRVHYWEIGLHLEDQKDEWGWPVHMIFPAKRDE